MQSFWLGAASFGLLPLALACSDGSGLIAGAGGAATTSSSGATSAGNASLPSGGSGTAVIGGTASTVGGAAPEAGASPTAGTGTGGASAGGSTGGAAGAGGSVADRYAGPFKVLVLDKTIDYPHDSIPICDLMLGIESFRAEVEKDRKKTEPANLGATPDAMMPAGTKPSSQFTAVRASEDLSEFTDENLKQYALIFSCNPTGTVFSANPKVKDKAVAMAAFQKFVEGGGAWAGVHSATDFEKTNGFPWFTNILVGAYFDHHDMEGTSGTLKVSDTAHPVMKGINANWNTQDEWYYMNRDVSAQPGFTILARLASDNRPAVWVKELGTGGRSFYTIRGHGKSAYEEPDFRKLVLNGILWATHRLN